MRLGSHHFGVFPEINTFGVPNANNNSELLEADYESVQVLHGDGTTGKPPDPCRDEINLQSLEDA